MERDVKTRFLFGLIAIIISNSFAPFKTVGACSSAFLEGGRFYSVATADLNGDGKKEIIAVGQKGPKKSHQAYIAVYEITLSY